MRARDGSRSHYGNHRRNYTDNRAEIPEDLPQLELTLMVYWLDDTC